jgi:hypothetical protein
MRNRWLVAILAIALGVTTLQLISLRQTVRDTHLAFIAFRVIDADSKQPISDYHFGSPTIRSRGLTHFPREVTLLRGSDFSLFFTVTPQPVTVRVSAEGYIEQTIQIEPRAYDARSGNLPGDVQTITLSKTPKA